MALSAGTRLGPYEIVDLLGAGGMGEVYRARDTRLDRLVAIKVLAGSLAADALSRARFEREARTVAALNHPHICTLHDIGRDEDVQYLVLEHLEGQTLASRLQQGPLAVDDAVTIARQILDALDAAHRAGIVHRDLKPGNIFLVQRAGGGHAPLAKLLDFGLAKLHARGLEGATVQTIAAPETEAGRIVGTLAYMSPEQAEGHATDARSDLFGVGAVLYEMLTGVRVFDGGSAAAILAAVLRSDPPLASGLRVGLPLVVDTILAQLLAKNPAARFDSAAEAAAALNQVSGTFTAATAAAPPAQPSIAVLPFANLSPDRENEYFADGLTDEIITDLSSIRALRVISRTSAMRFKSSERHLPSIAKELGVRFVLEGSVRRAGSNLRITAQLIDASEDRHLWGEKYTGSVDDVFAIQEEISRRIVTALKLRLMHSEERQIAARPIEDMRAYDCYLRARQEMYRWTPEGLERAEALVRNALEIVGENALLLATEGHIQWTYVNSGISPDESRLVRAEDCARRALALEPQSYQAVFVRGIVAGLRGRVEEAVQDLVTAYRRNPGDANVLTELSRFLFNAGQVDVLDLTSRALTRVDPLMPVAWICELVVHTGRGRFADAVSVARHLMSLLDPYSLMWIWTPWQALVPAGERAEAREILAQYATRAPSDTYRALARFLVAAIDGDAASARHHMTPAVESAASSQEHFARVLGEAYAQLGQIDNALRWLRASTDRGMIHYPFFTHDVLLDPIRHDPRFEEWMVSVKRRWEAFPTVTLA